MKACATALGQGVAGLPGLIRVLDTTTDIELCDSAADRTEEALSGVLETLADADPTQAAIILANNQAGFRSALVAPGWRDLSVYLADTWRNVKDRTSFSQPQSQAAEYWIKQTRQVGNSVRRSPSAAPAAPAEPPKPQSKHKKPR